MVRGQCQPLTVELNAGRFHCRFDLTVTVTHHCLPALTKETIQSNNYIYHSRHRLRLDYKCYETEVSGLKLTAAEVLLYFFFFFSFFLS